MQLIFHFPSQIIPCLRLIITLLLDHVDVRQVKRGRQTSYVSSLWFVAHLSILFLLWKSSEGVLAVDHKLGQHYDPPKHFRGHWMIVLLGRPHLSNVNQHVLLSVA